MPVPLVLLGMGVARMVATPLAKQLIKSGVGKAASKGAETAGKAINKVDDLPPAVTAKIKELAKPKSTTTSSAPKPGAKRGPYGSTKATKAKEAREGLKSRTQQTREQVAAARKPRKPKTSVPTKRNIGAEAGEKEMMGIAREALQKSRGAEQMRGAIKRTPPGQKGMRLPGKGETPKRRMGGKIYAQSRNMGGPIRKPRMK